MISSWPTELCVPPAEVAKKALWYFERLSKWFANDQLIEGRETAGTFVERSGVARSLYRNRGTTKRWIKVQWEKQALVLFELSSTRMPNNDWSLLQETMGQSDQGWAELTNGTARWVSHSISNSINKLFAIFRAEQSSITTGNNIIYLNLAFKLPVQERN